MQQHNSYKPEGLLIDLDGTIYHGTRVIEGAVEWLAALQAAQVRYLFVTNNSTAAPEVVAERLQAMGIPAAPAQVCTSAQASAAYIAERQPGASVFIIGEAGLFAAATEAGLTIIEGTAELEADYVLQGIDRQLSYERLTKAVRLIRQGSNYVLTNPDLLLPATDGLIPGAGSIGALLSAASGVKPTVIGKPSAVLVDFALRRLGITAERTLMVGDNLATDIAAGQASGCKTALVLTGITTPDNLASLAETHNVQPDYIFHQLKELHSLL
ncbi:TIGR01457 family HAD-type hydrolase [Paenibacillaceae bacterium]|nr:TIGR01457 family HAD-type hydrolase [Paenibacillaceae bacterium]